MKITLTIIILAFCIPCVAQKEDLIKYLDAYKISEFEESKAIIADYSFGQNAEYIMSEYSSISGLTFTSDIPSIKGYKAIIICKLQNKAGTFIEKRVMTVMYFDKIKKHWAVFGIREVADAKYEYETSKARVESGRFFANKEYDYRGVSWWAMMAGQITDAKKYIEMASFSAKERNNSSFTTENIEVAINRIM